MGENVQNVQNVRRRRNVVMRRAKHTLRRQ